MELPARLQKSVELEAFSQAVKYYVKTTNILQRYDNLPSFKQIHKECEQIIKDLKVVLKDRIRNPKVIFKYFLTYISIDSNSRSNRKCFTFNRIERTSNFTSK